MSATRVLVLGADAAGMSAAHQALRRARARGLDLHITALEQTEHTSYSACGLPYWIAGEVEDGEELVAKSPGAHRASGIDLRTGTRAEAIDLAAQQVHAVGPGGGSSLDYDELIIATGAGPRIPGWARAVDGGLLRGVLPVKTYDEAAAWNHLLAQRQERPRAAVVGAGYIGVEMVEALLRRGCEVELFSHEEVLPGFDAPVRERMRATLLAAGVKLSENAPVDGAEAVAGAVRAVRAADSWHEADLVVLATGVAPRTDLRLIGGTLPIGASGAYDPDDTQRLAPHVWTAGDCSTIRHRLLERRVHLPLGTHANKQGRVLGINLTGGAARSEGALGTAITRFSVGEHHLEVARTGLGEAEAREAGFDAVSLLTEGRTASGYMSEARPAAVHVIADVATRRLLGVQIAGGEGAAKRIDTAAAALWMGASIDDLGAMDLAYAPPFATVWEVVQLAARRLADQL